MKKSKHSKIRCQQRGIKAEHLALLLKYGVMNEKNGAFECSLPRQIYSEICSQFKQELNHQPFLIACEIC